MSAPSVSCRRAPVSSSDSADGDSRERVLKWLEKHKNSKDAKKSGGTEIVWNIGQSTLASAASTIMGMGASTATEISPQTAVLLNNDLPRPSPLAISAMKREDAERAGKRDLEIRRAEREQNKKARIVHSISFAVHESATKSAQNRIINSDSEEDEGDNETADISDHDLFSSPPNTHSPFSSPCFSDEMSVSSSIDAEIPALSRPLVPNNDDDHPYEMVPSTISLKRPESAEEQRTRRFSPDQVRVLTEWLYVEMFEECSRNNSTWIFPEVSFESERANEVVARTGLSIPQIERWVAVKRGKVIKACDYFYRTYGGLHNMFNNSQNDRQQDEKESFISMTQKTWFNNREHKHAITFISGFVQFLYDNGLSFDVSDS